MESSLLDAVDREGVESGLRAKLLDELGPEELSERSPRGSTEQGGSDRESTRLAGVLVAL